MVEITTQYRNFDTRNIYDTVNWKVTYARVYNLSRNAVRTVWSHVTRYQLIRNSYLTRRGSQVFISDCFEFWICFRAPKNKIYVFFYSGPFSYLGGETNPQSYKIFRCSSPIALNFFWICFRGPKNSKYVFFYNGPFSYLEGETTPQSSYGVQKLCGVKLYINLICVITCCMYDVLVVSHRY